ncbi:hypothetical protein EMN47_20075 [Prolixibacteraceae bacterium JC049]|nr:hypothetical protein [Prolixibacteraceae bacterium JC049]
MDTHKTVEILEALASGCSPSTGEMIANESVLNERSVIRALQIAIDNIRANQLREVSGVEIDEAVIKRTIELFKRTKQSLTPNKLVDFFLGIKTIKNGMLISNQLYGMYRSVYQKGQLLDFFTQYLLDNNLTKSKNNAYRRIDFFEKETFNKLSGEAINQLKQNIEKLGVLKTDDLSEYVRNARINHPRAYEAWSQSEKSILSKVLKYTNDLELLSECFQRGKGSIRSYGQKLIYEAQKFT